MKAVFWLVIMVSTHLILRGTYLTRSTWNEFIAYADLTGYCEISPEHSRDNDKRKPDGNFGHLTCPLTQHVLPILLATPTLVADI